MKRAIMRSIMRIKRDQEVNISFFDASGSGRGQLCASSRISSSFSNTPSESASDASRSAPRSQRPAHCSMASDELVSACNTSQPNSVILFVAMATEA